MTDPAPALAVLPARYASTRFPGKPLARRTGKYLIQHVYEQVQKARRITRIVVATDDARIEEAVRSFGGEVVMTGVHPNGTSRLAEAVGKLGDDAPDLVVNVQGDEPDIDPALIDALVAAMAADPVSPMGTVASPFAGDEDPANPNIVKVVTTAPLTPSVMPRPLVRATSRTLGPDAGVAGDPYAPPQRALYFSRALIPVDRDRAGKAAPLKHIGLYAYRRWFLGTYITLPATPLEQSEQLEQLRVLEHGYPILVVRSTARHHGIDTPEQYEEFVRRVGAGSGS